ncbi:ATP-binding response regulator [Chitinophaga vietnamensis]|uniref:ATP-binding response regulator n=1 Tax=Chitinophaga vietnamensis TaxID=2593957 RepID=UPI0011776669|nr:ATP-binding protein [Chitinophaga vietnamensis]
MRRPFLLLSIVLLLLFVLMAVFMVSGYRIHRHSAKQLLLAADTLSQDNPGLRLMDSSLLTLSDAENNFRLYTVTYKRKHLAAFSSELGQVLSMVDSISASLGKLNDNSAFDDLIKQKTELSHKIGEMKKATDSMLTHSLDDDMLNRLLRGLPSYNVNQIKKDDVTFDTLSSQQGSTAKRGFFKRVFSNKQDTVKAQMTIMVKTKSGKVIDKKTYDEQRMKGIITDVNTYYKNILRQQLANRLRINDAEQSLAGTNMGVLGELKSLIISLRDQTSKVIATRKQRTQGFVNTSVRQMEDISGYGLAALLVSLVLVAAGAILAWEHYRLIRQNEHMAREQARVRADFLNNMSHEIRTPLNSILGFSEQLSHTHLEKEQRDLLHSVEVAGDMLMQVVSDVLDFSKLENDYISIQRQPFVLYQAFEEVVDTMRIQADKKNLAFNVEFDGSKQWSVSGDAFRLKQILLNLISNAIKYTEKGSITVTAKLEKETESKAVFHCTVSDTGEGISPEAQARLFERFYQASSRSVTKGAGLGLAITKRLVELHGGNISFNSELNKGTSFTCNIPYEVVSAPLTVVVPQKEPQLKPGAYMEGRYVLIADDQEMNLLLLKMMLTRWKCRFDMATDGEVAIEMFDRQQYDLILLDLHMPKRNGLDVIEHIRKDKDPAKANVVVLALTANITEEDITDFRKAGFNDWLVKPFRERDIYSVIIKNLPPPVDAGRQEEA